MLMRCLYTLLLALASPVLLFGLYRKKPGKPTFGARWKEHWGFTPALSSATQPIWIHAASVGESLAVIPVIKALQQQYPNIPIVVTTTTSTGAEQIMKLGNGVEHRYMPIDFAWCVRGFLKAIQPRLFVIVERELWLNTLTTVKQHGIPTVVINARLSARSAQGYQRAHAFSQQLLAPIDQILCLHQDDAERFIALGAASDKVHVTGSIKYDLTLPASLHDTAHALRQQLGAQRPVFIAASTHKGEDEQVLDAYKHIQQQYPDVMAIIVPRHPERFDQVAHLCQQRQLICARRSHQDTVTPATQIYLADTMGEMFLMLAAADVCFIGGSLLGDSVGGHNVLEPAAVAKPTITGPSYYNFADITEQLTQAGAVLICQDSQQLGEQICALFSAPEQRQQMGQQGAAVVKHNQGAIHKTLHWLTPYLSH